MELRDLIAERLIGQVNPPQYPWRDRVVETHGMDPDMGLPPFGQLPWIVVRQAGTTVDQNRVQTLAFEVWIHAANTSFSALDELEQLAYALLNGTLSDPDAPVPHSYTLSYAGTLAGDQVIPAWDAYARVLRFTSSSGASLGGIQAADDPRAVYLRDNAASLFCPPPPCVQTDPNTWAPTTDCPGIYIRPVSGPVEVTRYSSQTIFRETLAVHVLAPTPGSQRAWADKLALELPGQLDYVQRNIVDSNGNLPRISTIMLRVTALNPAADAATDGQIRIEATFSELACDVQETSGPLRYVDITPHPTGGAELPTGSGPDVLLPLDDAFVIGRRRP